MLDVRSLCEWIGQLCVTLSNEWRCQRHTHPANLCEGYLQAILIGIRHFGELMNGSSYTRPRACSISCWPVSQSNPQGNYGQSPRSIRPFGPHRIFYHWISAMLDSHQSAIVWGSHNRRYPLQTVPSRNSTQILPVLHSRSDLCQLRAKSPPIHC
jgi:hypothetical protein